MWLITNFGFFSVVQKSDDPKLGTLTVRSRVREDLESLKEQYFKQTMGEIQVNTGTDYKYRAKVHRAYGWSNESNHYGFGLQQLQKLCCRKSGL